jgi:hypothetical protein
MHIEIGKNEYQRFQVLYLITLLYTHIKEKKPELQITSDVGISDTLQNLLLIEKVIDSESLAGKFTLSEKEVTIFFKLLKLDISLTIKVFGSDFFILTIQPGHYTGSPKQAIICDFKMKAPNFINYSEDNEFSFISDKNDIWGFGTPYDCYLYIDFKKRIKPKYIEKYREKRIIIIDEYIHKYLLKTVRSCCLSL